jgi:chromosome segregation ATPase
MSTDTDRTASLLTPAQLAKLQARPAASPAAWLDQMAADAGQLHVARLGELREQLESQVRGPDYGLLAAPLAGLGQALPALDFGLLQPRGWLARATGKARSAGAEFTAQLDPILQAVAAVKEQLRAVQDSDVGRGPAGDRTLVEFEVEWRAIEKVLDQGARWLHDMRGQIKSRQANAPDAAAQQQIAQDESRCELLVERLKALRALANSAQQVHQQAQGAAARRGALAQTLRQVLPNALKSWENRMTSLTAAARATGASPADMEDAADLQRELQRRVEQAGADCRQLQAQDVALSDGLAEFGYQLATAR